MNNTNLRDLDDGIGIDPTTVEVIESLDGPAPTGKPNGKNKPGKAKKATPDKKKKSKQLPLSSVIMVSVACLVLVGGGLYFYLHLANKDGGGGLFSGKSTYTPEDKIITVGDPLSTQITDYGSFPGVDLKECKLDTSGVDPNTVGEYPFYVTCGETKYNANVKVLEKPEFVYTPILTYINVGDDVSPESLFTSPENYGAEFPDPEYLKGVLQKPGIHRVDLRLVNINNQMGLVNAFILVSKVQFASIMTCASNEMPSNDKKYTITDTVYFDSTTISINTIRTWTYILSEDEVPIVTEDIAEDGTITYDGKYGYALLDNVNNVLQIVKDTSDGIVQTSEITKTKPKRADLEKYYKDTKGYICN